MDKKESRPQQPAFQFLKVPLLPPNFRETSAHQTAYRAMVLKCPR